MLKGFVLGEEKDIVKIPMKGVNILENTLTSGTIAGITYTVNSDKSITLNGTKTGTSSDYVTIGYIDAEQGVAYTISGVTGFTATTLQIFTESSVAFTYGNRLQCFNGPVTRTAAGNQRCRVNLYFYPNQTYNNVTIYPQIVIGSTALQYEPYGYQNGWEVRDNQNRIIWGREDELETTTGTLPFKGYGLDIKEYSIDGNMVQAAEKAYSITGTSPLDFQSNGSNATISISGNETQASNQAYTTSGTSPLSFNADGTNLTALSMDGNMNQASSQPYTVSGTSPISFMNNGTDIDYTVSGSMLQSGTPTPTSPITPQECGDDTGNLYPLTDATNTISDVVWKIENGTITGSGTRYSETQESDAIIIHGQTIKRSGNYINYCAIQAVYSIKPPAGTYNFTCDANPSDGNRIAIIVGPVGGYYSNGTARKITVNETFSVDGNEYVMLVVSAINGITQYSFANVMINGYKIPVTNGSTTYNIYLSEPLRKIGDYSDIVNSDGSVTRVIKKLVLTGQETYVQNGSYTQFSMTFSNQSDYTIASGGDLVISTHFKGIVRESIGSGGRITTRSTRNGLMMSHSSSADAAAFTAWVASQYESGTPVIAWYVLATPQTDTATVPTITPTSGNNTLSVDTTLAPSNITITSNSSVFPGNPITPIECGVLSENLFDNNQITTNENGAERPGVELPVGTYSIYNTSSRAVYYRIGVNGTGVQVNSGVSKANIVADDTLYVWQYPKEDGVMVIEGATAPTEYEPYGKYKIPITVGSTTKNIFINQPIRKIGNYSDSIGSDGVVTRNIGKLVLNGTEDWQQSSASLAFYIDARFIQYLKVQEITTMCTHYECVANTTDSTGMSDNQLKMNSNASYLIIQDNDYNSANEFKSYLASQYQNGTPVEVWYILSTPDTTETTTIPTISTASGSNVLITGTPITPSNITISTSSSVYPKNPIYPEECGDKTDNLWDYLPVNSTLNGVTIVNDNGVLKFSGTCNASANFQTTRTIAAGTYTISSNANRNPSSDENACIQVITTDLSINAQVNNNQATSGYRSITLPSERSCQLRIRIQNGVNYDGFELRPMMNTGSSALPFEPYGKYKVPIINNGITQNIYLDQPIRKIGDYSDVINSDGTVTRYINKLVLTGNEIGGYEVVSGFAAAKMRIVDLKVSSKQYSFMCSHFEVRNSGQAVNYGLVDNKYYNYYNIEFYLPSTITSTIEARAWFAELYAANNPVIFWYPLDTPTTEQTTIPTLTTVDGKNTATIGTTLAPSSITINATSKVYPNNPIIPEMCGVRTENLLNLNRTYSASFTTDTTKWMNGAVTVNNTGAVYAESEILGDVIKVTSKSNGYGASFLIEASPNTTYTVSFETDKTSSGSWGGISDRDINGTVISNSGIQGNSATFTTHDNCAFLNVCFRFPPADGTVTFSKIMLNLGSTALPYEPYGWKIPLDNYEENLISLPIITTESDGLTVSSSSESMTLFGNITRIYEDNPIWKQFDFTLDAGEYTLSLGEPRTYQNGYAPRLHKYDDGSVLTNYLINPVTFTLSERTHVYMAFYIDNKQLYNDKWMFRLRSGSTVNKTIPVYLGEVPTVRRIKKLVLTGEETNFYNKNDNSSSNSLYFIRFNALQGIPILGSPIICTHLKNTTGTPSGDTGINIGTSYQVIYLNMGLDIMNAQPHGNTVVGLKEYIASQYNSGTPVTMWYILAEPETGIVNGPICKISTYADELTTVQVHGLSAPLYGIGDYKDTLNLSTGVVTRKIKKWVLDGTEGASNVTQGWKRSSNGAYYLSSYDCPHDYIKNMTSIIALCSHYNAQVSVNMSSNVGNGNIAFYGVDDSLYEIYIAARDVASVDDFKSYLASQYAAGTPVTIWYVLNTPETETVTVPTGMTGEIEGYLTQISTPTPTNRSVPKWNGKEETGGTYAVTVYTPPEIQTVSGKNTITVRTEIPPSDFTIKAHARETGITEVHYGFKINKSVENSNDAVSYMYDAVTMTPAYMDYENDEFNYGSWENAFFVKDCYPVALNLNGTEAYKLDPNDYTKKLNGEQSDIQFILVTEEPSDWSTQWKQYYTKDSNDNYNINDQESEPTFAPNTYYKLVYNESFTGNFMMAFPKVWFYRHEDSSYNYVEISNCKLSDDWRCYAHVNMYGEEVDYIYLPLFKGVIKDSKLRSLPGQIPHGSSTAVEEVAAASSLGNRWQLWDHSSMECINDLLILMSKSIDSQTAFGDGVDAPIDFDNTYTYGKLQTGTLVKSGKFKGFSSSIQDVKVFGMEGLWSNRFDRMQGMLLVDNVWKIKMTPPYNFVGTDFLPLSNAEVPDGSGYISRVQTSEYGSIPASILNGSQEVFYKDYFFKNASGTRVAIHGGYCRNGSPCGFRCIGVNFDANSGPSWATDGVGASPVYK